MVSAILEGKPDKNLILVTGRTHPKLASDVAEQLGIDILETTAYDFANGEMYVRYTESVRGADVFVLQTHADLVNKSIMEQLIYHQDLRINIDRNSKSQTHEHTAGISLYRLVDKVSNVRKFQNIIQSGVNLFF